MQLQRAAIYAGTRECSGGADSPTTGAGCRERVPQKLMPPFQVDGVRFGIDPPAERIQCSQIAARLAFEGKTGSHATRQFELTFEFQVIAIASQPDFHAP